MACDSSAGASGTSRRGLGLTALVVIIALVVGFAAGWFGRSYKFNVETVQEGTFSLNSGEEKKIVFHRPFRAVPHLETEESNHFVIVKEVQPGYFIVRIDNPLASVSNLPWRARGVLAE
jgi:hypothetical protein